jgi:hypothetical protein
MKLRLFGKSPVPGEGIIPFAVCYDRYEYFPSSAVGYFFDVNMILAGYFSKKTDKLANPQKSSLYAFLKAVENKSDDLVDIYNMLLQSEELVMFRKSMKDEKIPFLALALFLWIRDMVREGQTLANIKEKKDFTKIVNLHRDDLKLALTMTGAFFGLKEFNLELYKMSGLPFIKTGKMEDQKQRVDGGDEKPHQKREKVVKHRKSDTYAKNISHEKSSGVTDLHRDKKNAKNFNHERPGKKIVNEIWDEFIIMLEDMNLHHGQVELLAKSYPAAFKRVYKMRDKELNFKYEGQEELLVNALGKEIQVHDANSYLRA